MKKNKSIKYQDELIKSLKKPKEATAYLNAALEDGDLEIFLLALRNVAEALGGLSQVAKKAKLNRENLYRMLSSSGNPEIASLTKILGCFGMRLAVHQVSRSGNANAVSI